MAEGTTNVSGANNNLQEKIDAIYDKIIKEHMVDLPFTKVSDSQLDCDSTGYDYLVLTYNCYNTGDISYFIDKNNFTPFKMRGGTSSSSKSKQVLSVSDSAISLEAMETESWFIPVSVKGIL